MKIKKGVLRNLTVRWMLIMCSVILPLNILTTGITVIISSTFEEQMTDSYENQLRMYTDRLQQEISNVQTKFKEFLTEENVAVLTMGGKSDSVVEMLRLKMELETFLPWLSLSGICYIYENQRDIMSLLPCGRSYHVGQMQQVREEISSTWHAAGIYTTQRCFSIEDAVFLTKEYNFQRFSVGVLYDAETILRDFNEGCGEVKGDIYLTDEMSNVIARLDRNGNFCIESTEFSEIRKNENRYFTCEGEIGYSGYKIIWINERNEVLATLPILVKILWALTVCSFVALPLLCMSAARLVIKPLWKLCQAMKIVEEGNLKYRLEIENSTYQMDYLYVSFNHMVEEIHYLITESYEKEIDKLQAESLNVQLQVNQHMLLNFLNTIYSLSSAGKQKQVNEFTLLLMKYFRYVLRKNTELVTVAEEIAFVKDYMQLQGIRFPESFTGVYYVEEEAEQVLIPQLLIENFVENAIKHGLVMGSEIEIIINVRKKEDKLSISICDTGNGIPAEIVEQLQNGEIIENKTGKHIGIWNCCRRMRLYYGEQYQMKITSKAGEGTQIWIEIPVKPLEGFEVAPRLYRGQKEGE